ncbi:MAG: linear amide C-N hydrolase, partial [Psychrosphaera sp.]|nr:linear amide C-N hydrolase [Psychrosphaera sp.]
EPGKLGQCHLSVSDAEGNSAIFEYVDGELFISSNVQSASSINTFKYYPVDEMRVMTNDPVFSQQLLLNGYWETINDDGQKNGEDINLPGSSMSPDRFVRASHYSKHLLTKGVDNIEALAGLASVMRNAARPIGKEIVNGDESKSATWYTSLFTQLPKKSVYYYQSMYSPFMIWLDLGEILLRKEFSDDKFFKLTLDEKNGVAISPNHDDAVSGNVIEDLRAETGFEFMVADPQFPNGRPE